MTFSQNMDSDLQWCNMSAVLQTCWTFRGFELYVLRENL
jgi:hypothetical protein